MTISLSKNIIRDTTTEPTYTEMKPSLVELQQRLFEFYGDTNVRLTLYDILCILVGKDPTIPELVTITIEPMPSDAIVVLELKE